MTNPYPIRWACSACFREYDQRHRAEKCCTKGHENGWGV